MVRAVAGMVVIYHRSRAHEIDLLRLLHRRDRDPEVLKMDLWRPEGGILIGILCRLRIQPPQKTILAHMNRIEMVSRRSPQSEEGSLKSTRAAVANSGDFKKILEVAYCYFGLKGCIGARFGHGVMDLPKFGAGITGITFWWHVVFPDEIGQLYDIFRDQCEYEALH